ncbi:MAG: aminopeptidase P family protein [Planctomycetota bacterium]
MANTTTSIPTERQTRLRSLRRRLRDAELDALLILNPTDTHYLTGFSGEDSWTLVHTRAGGVGGGVVIFSDGRFDEQIRREAPWAKAVMRDKGLSDELAKWVDKRKTLKRIGTQPGRVTLPLRKALVKALGAKAWDFKFDDGLAKQRAVKDAGEVKLIEKALRIQEKAFTETMAVLTPGMTELEACAELEYRMKRGGSLRPSFETIVAADANAAMAHARPGTTKLKRNGLVLFDWGAVVQGYCSDMTRVVGLGGMKPKMREVYQIVLEAQLAGIDAVKPGVSFADADAAARKVIEDAGYGEAFSHSLGHGLGLDIHEWPGLSKRQKGVFEVGMVVTIEPGIYLPGVGGVRIEDDVLVTAKGCRVLSRLPKTLDWAII